MAAKVGAPAPDFELESDAGNVVTLRDFAARWLVLYFYPRDATAGCTREAQDFTQAAAGMRKLGAAVVGVSKDSVKRHAAFRDKVGIGFPLLSDPDLAAHRAYGVWGTKTMYGKRVEGTIRSTFLISPARLVDRIWSGVRVGGHVDEVLEALRAAHDRTAGARPARP